MYSLRDKDKAVIILFKDKDFLIVIVYPYLTECSCYYLLLLNSVKFCYAVIPANQDFPCLVWKIAISSLITSALAALMILYIFKGFSVSINGSSVNY